MQPWLTIHASVDAYLQAAEPWLATQEVEGSLALGVPLLVRSRPDLFADTPRLATLHERDPKGERIVGAAVQTPPRHLVLHADSGHEALLADRVADWMMGEGWMPSGVNGRVPAPARFVEVWRRLTGQEERLETRMGAYVLHQVIPPRPTEGDLRVATLADLELVFGWMAAFAAEALPYEASPPRRESVELTIEGGGIFLWDDGDEPVSLAGRSRQLLRGVTIGPVYTPPALRGRGYAGNAVAALAQALLQQGNDFCCLFADEDNPISTHIYRNIGFRHLCDYTDYGFVDPAP